MLLGVPTEVKRFFAPVVSGLSRPIGRALPMMVLAFLLSPHRRCLKTIAGTVAGDRVHVATISRRLVNPRWKTRDWYVDLYDAMWRETDAWERSVAQKKRRQWTIPLDATCHGTVSECMENLILMSRRQDPRRRSTRQHAFLMGMILTDRGGRIPLPRRSYYTKQYCQKHGRRYRTLNDLAVLMLQEITVPEDVDVTVVFDSAFDADKIHRVCRARGFREVFPIDPNRVLAASEEEDAAGIPGERIVAWTRNWGQEEFELIELQVKNEDLVYFRRRHVELFFRELKSRLQFGCYVLMKFEAVERYVAFLLMGFLFLEHKRLTDMKQSGPPSDRGGEPWVQARVTDRLRDLEALVHEWNLTRIEEALKTKAGRRRLLKELRKSPCRVS